MSTPGGPTPAPPVAPGAGSLSAGALVPREREAALWGPLGPRFGRQIKSSLFFNYTNTRASDFQTYVSTYIVLLSESALARSYILFKSYKVKFRGRKRVCKRLLVGVAVWGTRRKPRYKWTYPRGLCTDFNGFRCVVKLCLSTIHFSPCLGRITRRLAAGSRSSMCLRSN